MSWNPPMPAVHRPRLTPEATAAALTATATVVLAPGLAVVLIVRATGIISSAAVNQLAFWLVGLFLLSLLPIAFFFVRAFVSIVDRVEQRRRARS